MLSVELGYLAGVLDDVGQAQNISQSAKEWSHRINNAIWSTTVSLRQLVTFNLKR